MNTKMRTVRRGGFTLVELLTVIIIIAVLAGLVTGSVAYAVRSVNESTIRAEIGQLEAALNAYKAEFGEFPPDGLHDSDTPERHVKRCFRNAGSGATIPTVTPETALYTFLGPRNANPRNPFFVNASRVETKPFFAFDEARLVGGKFYPRNCTQPYIYLKAVGQQGKRSYTPGTAYPAYTDHNGNWYNEDSFQIICAGLDNDWGATGTVQVTDGNINAATGDNIVNFSRKLVKDLLD